MVIVTARNVTVALYGASDASDAYESSEKILSVVNYELSETSTYQNSGQTGTVTAVSTPT